jgi:hypothetical protein
MGRRKKDIKDWWFDNIRELTELNGINVTSSPSLLTEVASHFIASTCHPLLVG